MNLATVEIKAFVPARDFAASKAFYTALGFEVPWSSDDLAYVRHGATSFLLQKFYVAEHAGNFMMHLLVDKFGIRLESPAERPWGLRDFAMTDPAGVLWRVGQNIAPAA